LTDAFPELREVCGDSVLYASDPASYREAMTRYVLRYPDLLERTGRLWERLRREYSFETRAQQIVSEASSLKPEAWARRSAGATPVVSEPLRELTSELLIAARAQYGARELHVFHAFPTSSGVAHLHAQEGINYLSAGLGPGPWHIALSEDVDQIPEDRFDFIVVEDCEVLERLGATERGDFLRALALRLRAFGMLGVATGAEKECWRALVGSLGLAVVAEGGRWMIAARQRSPGNSG
jgi:hypothetical protein